MNRLRPVHVAVLLIAFVALSLSLRTYFLYGQVFTADYVNFQGADPWYHVRAVTHLVEQFPHRIEFDPYALYPGGQRVAVAPLYDLVLAGVVLVLGFGSPTIELMNAVAAWFPAVLGSLVVFPVYFLGKMLRDRQAGLIAAAWIAILPGAFLRHSLLGYTDHHVAESLLSAVTLAIVMLALERERQLSAGGENGRGFRVRRLLFPLMAGCSLGGYLLVWVGGSLLVLMIFLALFAQIVIDYLKNRAVGYVVRVAIPMFLVALVMVIPYRSTLGFNHHIIALVGATVALAALAAVAGFLASRGKSKLLFPPATFILSATAVLAFYGIAPAHLAEVIQSLRIFLGGQAGTTVLEAMPFLYPYGHFSLAGAWNMFTTGSVTTILSLFMFMYMMFKRGAPRYTLILIGTLLVLAATLRQQRFAYYLAINVAVMSGVFWSSLSGLLGRLRGGVLTRTAARRAIVACVIPAAAWLPNIGPAVREAKGHAGPHSDWFAAMEWLRENSPEPFEDEGVYTRAYETPAPGVPYRYPDSAYGILCWWDHGYWIQHLARRIPVANPTQAGAAQAAAFLTAPDETTANRIREALGAKYVVVDYTLPAWEQNAMGRLFGKYGRILDWAGKPRTDYYEWFYARREDGKLRPLVLFYPGYYQSFLTRLYVFGGQPVVPEDATLAILYSDRKDGSGKPFKLIEKTRPFKTYAAALAFVERQTSDRWRIAGRDPTRSCVPLEGIRNYKRVYASPTKVARGRFGYISYVEIFEYRE